MAFCYTHLIKLFIKKGNLFFLPILLSCLFSLQNDQGRDDKNEADSLEANTEYAKAERELFIVVDLADALILHVSVPVSACGVDGSTE